MLKNQRSCSHLNAIIIIYPDGLTHKSLQILQLTATLQSSHFSGTTGSLTWSLLPSRAALTRGNDFVFTRLLLSLTEESGFKVALVTERGVGEQRDMPAFPTGCCCCCFPGRRANGAAGIIHTATWMHLDGTPPQAVRRAPGYLLFPKEFPEHAAGEGDTPPFFFFLLFFTSVCRCALCLQLSKSYPNHLVPPASLSWLSYHKWLHKETRFLPRNSFWSSAWCQLCFGWMGGGGPVVCGIFASWR